MFKTHEAYIQACYALARQAVDRGNQPFGALLVRDGAILLRAENTEHTDRDPTRHAELNLVSQAARQFGVDALADCTLYTSTSPCAMCAGAIYWAGISTVVYGCSETTLAASAGDDFLIPCKTIFAHGQRPMTVIGPVLEAEGAAILAAYWSDV
jgi:tRNA(Arg) A34 adenosine deaminase TadA